MGQRRHLLVDMDFDNPVATQGLPIDEQNHLALCADQLETSTSPFPGKAWAI